MYSVCPTLVGPAHDDNVPTDPAFERWKKQLRPVVYPNLVLMIAAGIGDLATDFPGLTGERSCESRGSREVVARCVEGEKSASLYNTDAGVDEVSLLSCIGIERGADVEDDQSIRTSQDRHDFREGLRGSASG